MRKVSAQRQRHQVRKAQQGSRPKQPKQPKGRIPTRASTCVADYTYDKDAKVLVIYFVKGGSHTYYDISQDVVNGLASAGSKGQYFNKVIR